MSLRVDQAMDPPQSDKETKSISIGPPLVTSSSTTTPTSANTPTTDIAHHTADNVSTSRHGQYGKRDGDTDESLKRVDTHHYHSYTTDPRGDEDDEDDVSESDGESNKTLHSPTGTGRSNSGNTSPVRDGNLSSILRPSPTTRRPDIQPQPTTDHPKNQLYTTRPSGSSRGLTTTTTALAYQPLPPSNDLSGASHATGQKRRFSDTSNIRIPHESPPAPPPPPLPSFTSSLHVEIRGSHGPRDELRYETWTSKQLRKKCSHLKLRGLKNVKKHVMVEALYRYYHTHPQELQEEVEEEEEVVQPSHSSQRNSTRYMEERYPNKTNFLPHPTMMHRGRPSSTSSLPVDSSATSNRTYDHHKTNKHEALSMDEESKLDSFENEIRITSDDVVRLIDVMLSSDFVDRWISELSRWQFWVDVREKYLCKLKEEEETKYSSDDRVSLTSYSRNTRWSSMQLWEMWKELTFSYTKTCFEFTTAGANECDYLYYCKGRPDVYYLHQRLHSRPDLLHLIKSNEYIEEKESGNSGLETTAAANALMKVVGSPRTTHSHKRFKRLMPTNSSTSSINSSTSNNGIPSGGHRYNGKEMESNSLPAMANASNSNGLVENPVTKKRTSDGEGPITNGLSSEGSTENSETIEETSMDKTNSNFSSSRGSSQRSQPCGEELTEQKYFGLLLQNFEAIFESLHNKKILLAALRKDKSAPDHLIADLHDDIHVLSALKKEFRNKLRQTLE